MEEGFLLSRWEDIMVWLHNNVQTINPIPVYSEKMIKVMNFVTCFCLYYYIKSDEPEEMIEGWWVLP